MNAAVNAANKRGENVPLFVIQAANNDDTIGTWVNGQEGSKKAKLGELTDEFMGKTEAQQPKYVGSNAQSLGDAFESILHTIQKETTRVTKIEDTLSKWVDPDGWPPANSTGDEVDITRNPKIQVWGPNANEQLTTGYNVTYNAKSRKITVTFASPGITTTAAQKLILKFPIKPSRAAYQQYMDNADAGKSSYLHGGTQVSGKPDKGQANTGDHSNQEGFRSNTNATGYYRYCPDVGACDTQTSTNPVTSLPYPHPVVQVKVNPATYSIPVTKTVQGTPGWRSGDSFTFTLTAKNGAPMPKQNTVTIGKAGSSNTATGKFGEITYNKSGTYEYEVTENGGTGLYTYSKAKYTVSVKVTSNPDVNNPRYQVSSVTVTKNQNDDGTGASGSVQSAVFTNKNATVTVGGFAVQKNLVGRDWNDSDSFTFELNRGSGSSSAPLPAGCRQASCTVSINHDSVNKQAKFGDFTFTEPGTYHYTVSEQKGDITSIMYSQATYAVTVDVRGKDNTLQATVTAQRTHNDDGSAPAPATTVRGALPFTNTWITVSKLPLTGEGGATPLLWLAAAGGLGAFALLILGGVAIWRKRQTL